VIEIVQSLAVPSAQWREAINKGPTDLAAFHAAFGAARCLHQIEQVQPAAPPATPLRSARVVFWNAERLKYLKPSIELLEATGADAFLLCELDFGMARSGNRHTAAELAQGLGAGYVFGVEFVELDLGDARERRWHAGEQNLAALHGAALASKRPLHRPALLRLEKSGRWFDAAFGERRVGGRVAVMAELALAEANVLLVSVHYESHSDAPDRLTQTRDLLDAIDRHAPGLPVLIGGDFNTSTFALADKERPDLTRAALDEDPQRLLLPMAYEPMFEEVRLRGYDWERCNVMGAATQRTRPDGTPRPPFGRIDWFFARGLECSDPAMIPAVDAAGLAISDHDALAVTIRPAET
jgi:endonuclease/exonuclease/phosphatase family metal-dependent hydrolase